MSLWGLTRITTCIMWTKYNKSSAGELVSGLEVNKNDEGRDIDMIVRGQTRLVVQDPAENSNRMILR